MFRNATNFVLCTFNFVYSTLVVGMDKWEKTRVHEYNSSNHYVLRHNRFSTVSPKLPPVIEAPRGCCGHASGTSLLLPPWFAVCAPHATPSSVPGPSYCCTLFCLKSYIFPGILTRFLIHVFCRVLSSGLVERKQKKYKQQPTKNTPRGEQTSYRLDYSLTRIDIECAVENQYNRLLRQQYDSKAMSASKGTTTVDHGNEKNRRLRDPF